MDPTQQPVAADAILSAFRTLLGAAVGYIAAKGWIPQDQVGPVVTAVITIGGLALPVAWGVIEKFRAEKNTQVRIAAAVASTPVSSTSQGVKP